MPWESTENLQIRDITLWQSQFNIFSEDAAEIGKSDRHPQKRQGIANTHIIEVVDEIGDSFNVLRVLVELGVRVVRDPKDSSSESSPDVLYVLEATYAADYRINGVVPQEGTADYSSLLDFVQSTCIHNVWPFWRQHVYSTLKSASLQLVEIPLRPALIKGTKKIAPKKRKKAS